MTTFTEKITRLKSCLETVDNSYADSFKAEMLLYFGDFNPKDPKLFFLHDLDFEEEIINWVNRITSLIVSKFEEEEEMFGEFGEWCR
ncbi:hypothetical protein D3C87_64600 [compost metagenome]